MMQELTDRIDLHENNQARFNLPSRTLAKIFVFKLLYGATAYGYAHDPDFMHISTKERFWQDVIDEFYGKYKGIHLWHKQIIQTVQKTGKLVMPTGRVYEFRRYPNFKGEMTWPLTQIKNYPVQGLGADLVAIGRVAMWRRIKKAGLEPVLFQSTVHDSIDLDTVPDLVYNVCKIVKESISDIPLNFKKLFKTDFNLPVYVEIKYGPNLGELTLAED